MGLVYADIHLTNLADTILAKAGHLPKEKVRRMTTSMMADSGANDGNQPRHSGSEGF